MESLSTFEAHTKRVATYACIALVGVLFLFAVLLVYRHGSIAFAFDTVLLEDGVLSACAVYYAKPLIVVAQLVGLLLFFAYLAKGDALLKKRLSLYALLLGVLFLLFAGIGLAASVVASGIMFPYNEASPLMVTDSGAAQSLMLSGIFFVLSPIFHHACAMREDAESFV